MEPQEHPEDLQEEATPHDTPLEGLARLGTAHSQVPVPVVRLLAGVRPVVDVPGQAAPLPVGGDHGVLGRSLQAPGHANTQKALYLYKYTKPVKTLEPYINPKHRRPYLYWLKLTKPKPPNLPNLEP